MPAEKILVFRRAGPEVARMVWGSLERWFGPRVVEALKTYGEMYVASNGWAEAYLVPGEQASLIEQLREATGLHPYSAGLFLGYLEKGRYRPSLPLAHVVAKYAERGVVAVSDKAAQLFLYGRDVFSGSITRFLGPLRKGDLVVVLNPLGEALGYGEVVSPPQEWLHGSEIAVRNLQDLGWYLRRGG